MSVPNPLASARELFSIVREISLDELHDAALRTPRIAVVGPTIDDARKAAVEILGAEARVHVVATGADDPWPSAADIVLLDRSATVPRRRVDADTVLFSVEDEPERILREMFRIGDDLELRVGRTFPAVRSVAAMHVVNTTSRANAEFALVSALPELIPIVGGVLAIGADTIVLTKNQLMMLYKLAAIHGRDIDNRLRIYAEMAPVVGAAMVWRTLARDLVTILPFAAGAVPKVLIAFAGTYAVGRAADAYYIEGRKVSPERMRGFYRDALTLIRERPLGLTERVRALRARERTEGTTANSLEYQVGEDSPGMP